MSTPLKSVKDIMCFTKTTVNRAIAEGEQSGIFSDFLKSVGIDKRDIMTVTEMEAQLFTAITDQNISDNEKAYSGRYPEDRQLQAEQVTSTLGNISKLDSLSLPSNHISNAMFVALTEDIIHGIDSKSPLLSALNELFEKTQVLAVESQPEFKGIDSNSMEQAALAVTSMRSWGDMMLRCDRAMRMAMDALESHGTTESGNDRLFYPEEVLASLMKNLYHDDFKSVIFYGKEDAFTLQNVVSLTGMKFNINSDIPRATNESMFACVKLMNDIKAKVSTDDWSAKMKEAHPDISDYAVTLLRRDVNNMTKCYNGMVSRTLPGYQRYYNKGIESDNAFTK